MSPVFSASVSAAMLAFAGFTVTSNVWAAEGATDHHEHDGHQHSSLPLQMTVVRDAETGALRPATAAELVALARRQAESAVSTSGTSTVQGLLPKYSVLNQSARGVRMTDAMVSSVVATRQANGKLEMQCLPNPEAQSLVQRSAAPTPAPRQSTLETE